MTNLVVVDAEVAGRPGMAVRIEAGVVVAVGPVAGVPRQGAEVLDAADGALLPGLHDHHLHLLALAARLASLDLGEAASSAEADALLARARPSAGRVGDAAEWVRVAGYDEHRHSALDRHRLDAVVGPVPVRVQHRSGLSWVVSSAAMERLGLALERRPGERGSSAGPGTGTGAGAGGGRGGGADPVPVGGGTGVERDAAGRATGWLHRLDAWLGERVAATPPALAPVGRLLASRGITGITDTTPALGDGALDLLARARTDGTLPQRLVLLGRDDDTGLAPWASMGARKLVVDEHADPDLDALVAAVADAHAAGRGAALHCVTRTECVLAATAVRVAGSNGRDRLEHASVLPPELDAELAAAAITVVTQPAFVAERGDHYLEAVEPADVGLLYRLASLRAAGIRVGLSSDAPVASVDPWAGMAAAVRRRTRSGRLLGMAEALDPLGALQGYLGDLADPGGPARRVAVSAPADLCLLAQPLAAALGNLDDVHVRATLIGGEPAFLAA